MSNQFNFKAVHLFLLSLFVFLLVLSVTGSIDSSIISDFIIKYSIFGIIVCLVSWHVESKIDSEAMAITGEIFYEPDWHNYRIYEKLSEKNQNRQLLILILILVFIISLLTQSIWWVIYPISGFFYFFLLKYYYELM